MTIRSSSDFGAGLLLSGGAVFFLYLGWPLERGTAFQMGPGFFPTAVGLFALVVGLIQIVKSLAFDGPPIESIKLPPAVLVFLAIICFALLVGTLGLILTGTMTMILASLATPQKRWIRMMTISVILSCLSGLLFVVALGLSMPLWPAF